MDFVSLPYVRSADDVLDVRDYLDQHGGSRVKVHLGGDCWC